MTLNRIGRFVLSFLALAAIAAALARSEVENQQILLSNPGVDFTLGNGTLVLSILYFVATL